MPSLTTAAPGVRFRYNARITPMRMPASGLLAWCTAQRIDVRGLRLDHARQRRVGIARVEEAARRLVAERIENRRGIRDAYGT